MTFISLTFLLFLLAVIIVNYCLPQKYRWIFLLLSSYYFYMNWQPIYAVLLFATSVITYLTALLMNQKDASPKFRKCVCIVGCLLPLFSLSLFKYYNFITDTFEGALTWLGIAMTFPKIEFLMPLGISFYTFSSIGYMIDVYRGNYEPEKNFGILCAYVAFFAQISSGPIPRGNHLIPQLKRPENLNADNIMGGLRTMVWGFFMKLCVADRFGIYIDTAYTYINEHNGLTLFMTSLLYTIQIYCDFAGYSLIAIGAAKMLGIRLSENFRRPYFSKSLKEFWSRWHISLSTWFKDYVYIPLGGNRVSKKRNIFNLTITFLLSGLWHGAAWNFLLWGGLHGVGQAAEKHNPLKHKGPIRLPGFVKICFVFILVNFLWVFFRLRDIDDVGTYFEKIFTDLAYPFLNITLTYGLLPFALLFVKEWIDEYHPKIKLMSSDNIIVSNVATGLVISFILLFGVFDNGSFIYFQF